MLETGGNECTACDGLTGFNPLDGQDSCLNVTQCGVGEEEFVAPTPSTDRLCAKCPPGEVDHDASGATACVPCSLGETYMPIGAQTECLPTTQCKAGEEEFIPATYVSDRLCIACEEGISFKAEVGQSVGCSAITQCRFPGLEYVAVPATRTSDTVCALITRCDGETQWRSADATLLSDAECSALTQCDVLATEYIAVAKTPTSDRVCAGLRECVQDEYEAAEPTATTDRVCKPHTVCGPFQYDIVKSTPTSDRQCIDVVEATAYAALPLYTANFSTPLSWSLPAPNVSAAAAADRRRDDDGGGAVDVLHARQAALNATWERVHAAASEQALASLEALGLSLAEDVARVTVSLVHVADEGVVSAWNMDAYGTESVVIAVHVLFTTPEAWNVFMAGLVSGVPGASQQYDDWPLVLAPCPPEAYLSGAMRVAQNGSVLVPCASRQQCVLGETFASWAGNRTADRSCQTVQSCEHGERRAPTLTSDRSCRSPATSEAAAATGTLGAIVALVLVLLVLVLVVVVYRRRRAAAQQGPRKTQAAPGDMQTRFVNPSFVGRVGGRAGLQNALYADNDVRNVLYAEFDGWHDDDKDADGGLYCDLDDLDGIDEMREARMAAEGGGLKRAGSKKGREIIQNPLYEIDGGDDGVEGLYDEVVPTDESNYFDVRPDAYMDAADLREDDDNCLAVNSDDEDDQGGYMDVRGADEAAYMDVRDVQPARLVANAGYLDVRGNRRQAAEEEDGGYLDVNAEDEEGGGYLDVNAEDEEGGGYMDVNAEDEEGGGYLDVRPEPEEDTVAARPPANAYATLSHGSASAKGSLYARLTGSKSKKDKKKKAKGSRKGAKVAPGAAAAPAPHAQGDDDGGYLNVHEGEEIPEDENYMSVTEATDGEFVGFASGLVAQDSDGEDYFDLDAGDEE